MVNAKCAYDKSIPEKYLIQKMMTTTHFLY